MERRVFELFALAGKELYLVGGAVRDKLLGVECKDFDFATNALPEETKSILQKAGYHTHEVGWAYGTVGFVLDGFVVQVTTYRKNEEYQRDNRKPVVDWGKTINDDLTRRDFTINALAEDADGSVIDLFNGREHLSKGLIETPINAEEAFGDDPLRMLRAVRFKSKFGFKYSSGVEKALASQAHRLLILPRERIKEELDKLLVGEHVKEALNDLLVYKLLNYFIPELVTLNTVEQHSEYHHKNVWLHTLDVVSNSPKEVVGRYAALFHDIGKLATLTIDGGVHFYRHEEVGAFMTKSILNRLGLPRKWVEEATYLVRNHMRANLYDGTWSDTAVRRFIRDVGPSLDGLLSLSEADITSHRAETVQLKLGQLKELRSRISALISYREVRSPLNGEELMKTFNLAPGKKLGEIKDALVNALLEGKLSPNEDKQVYLDYVTRNNLVN